MPFLYINIFSFSPVSFSSCLLFLSVSFYPISFPSYLLFCRFHCHPFSVNFLFFVSQFLPFSFQFSLTALFLLRTLFLTYLGFKKTKERGEYRVGGGGKAILNKTLKTELPPLKDLYCTEKSDVLYPFSYTKYIYEVNIQTNRTALISCVPFTGEVS